MPLSVRPSQCDRMWQLLQDGHWHSDAELWEHGIGRPNSRAAELRTRHQATIEHRKEPAEKHASRAHQYRLVREPVQLTLGEVA